MTITIPDYQAAKLDGIFQAAREVTTQLQEPQDPTSRGAHRAMLRDIQMKFPALYFALLKLRDRTDDYA